MSTVKDRIFVGGQHPSSDVNPWLDDLAGSLQDDIDNMAPEVYGSVAGSKTPFKPFIIGFIPPDVSVNFIRVEQDKSLLGTVEGKSGAKAPAPTSTVQGQSASGGRNVFGVPSGPTELPKTETVFSEKALGNSIYNNLKQRGMSEEEARRLTPLFVGQAGTEISRAPGGFKTHCFNIGNVHSRGPGQGGYYYTSKDVRGNSEKGFDPRPGADNSYTTYFIGATDLDHGVDRWVGTTLQWKAVRSANNGAEFAAALRPDLYPENRGGNNGAYFTDGKTKEEVANRYGRNVQAGANGYATRNPDFTKPDPNGVQAGGSNEVQANSPSGVAQANRANIMTDGGITAYEQDDPIGGRTGRNLRLVKDERAAVAAAQVADLQAQIKAAIATPALYMLIAPQSFNRSYDHTVDTPKARGRHIVHMWLEKPMTISCKGVTAAQYIMDGQGAGGLSHQKRIHSLAYRNLMSLVRIYKNNGWLYTKKSSGDRNNGMRQIAMSIYIYFDGHVYIGSFDDFTITDTAEKPYNLEYSFKFTVRYDMDVTSTTDSEVAKSIGGR